MSLYPCFCHCEWGRRDLYLKCDQRRYLIIIYLPCFILFLLPSDDARETAAAATSLNVDRVHGRRGAGAYFVRCIFSHLAPSARQHSDSVQSLCRVFLPYAAIMRQVSVTLGNLWFHKLQLYGHSAQTPCIFVVARDRASKCGSIPLRGVKPWARGRAGVRGGGCKSECGRHSRTPH